MSVGETTYARCDTCAKLLAIAPMDSPDDLCDCLQCHHCDRMIPNGEAVIEGFEDEYAFCNEQCSTSHSEAAFERSLGDAWAGGFCENH